MHELTQAQRDALLLHLTTAAMLLIAAQDFKKQDEEWRTYAARTAMALTALNDEIQEQFRAGIH